MLIQFTAKAYNAAIPPGSQQVVPYSIQAYFPGPRILHLSLVVQFAFVLPTSNNVNLRMVKCINQSPITGL